MRSFWLPSLILALALAGCSVQKAPLGMDERSQGHPALSPEEQLQPCYQCHVDATPEVYEQWYNSGHGLDHVRCFQCHGGYGEIRRTPDEFRCSVCHAAQSGHKPQGVSCWTCHPAHKFSAHE